MKICRTSLIIILAALCLSGCSGLSVGLRPTFPSGNERGSGAAGSAEPSDARARASFQLTQQGKALLEEGKPDDAISVLERAVGLDPTSGRNYYYLATAWIMKDNLPQAEEFNRLAGIYLEDDYAWMRRVREQKQTIDSLRK